MPKLVLVTFVLLTGPVSAQIIETTFGQGYSLAEGETEFDVEAYDGTGPAVGGTLGLHVNRIEIEPVKLELEMGETFSLHDLKVRAFGRNNSFVGSAPVTIRLEAPSDLIGLELFTADGHTLRADQPGIGRLWIYSIAPPVRGENYSVPVVLVVNGQRALPQPPFLY